MASARYLDGGAVRVKAKRSHGAVICAYVTLCFFMFVGVFAAVPALHNPILKAKLPDVIASGSINFGGDVFAICSQPDDTLGYNMGTPGSWKSSSSTLPLDNLSSRTLNAQEAVGGGAHFVNFYGFGEGKNPLVSFLGDPPSLKESGSETPGDDESPALASGVTDRLTAAGYTFTPPNSEWFDRTNASRTGVSCSVGSLGTVLANAIIGLANMTTNLSGSISTFAFTPSIICDQSSNNPSSSCIDLVGIIGGDGKSDSGIIGSLTSSIYIPLLGLIGIAVAVWVIVNGVVKRQFRQTISGALWCVCVIILGVALLTHPQLLARAPMQASNTIAQCVIGTFSGSTECTSSNTNDVKPKTEDLCNADAQLPFGTMSDKASLTMSNLNCKLWQAFVAQPYAQGSFGMSFHDLDVGSTGQKNGETKAQQILTANGMNGDQFCVYLKPTDAPSKFEDSTLKLSGSTPKYCNVALYQMLLQVDAENGPTAGKDGAVNQGRTSANQNVDPRWLQVATFASADSGVYNSWAPGDLHFRQIGMSLFALVASIGAGIVIVVTSVYALTFLFTSIILMAFAPFFLLAGVHPGRGKKIMYGWLGHVLTNVMKFMASAIFLVITVSIYAAVLSKVQNIAMSLIFVLILTLALLMYRREIVDMLGVVDLGGEKLSNKLGSRLGKMAGNTGKTAVAFGAGAAASGALNPLRADNWNPLNTKNRVVSATRSGRDSARRSMKTRPGLVSDYLQASDKVSTNNKKRLDDNVKRQTTVAEESKGRYEMLKKRHANNANEVQQAKDNYTSRIDKINTNITQAKREQPSAKNRREELVKIQGDSKTLNAISNPDIKKIQGLLNQIEGLKISATIATQSGDKAKAQRIQARISTVNSNIDNIKQVAGITEEQMNKGREQYYNALAKEIPNGKVTTAAEAQKYVENTNERYASIESAIQGESYQRFEALQDRDDKLDEISADDAVVVKELNEAKKAAHADKITQGIAVRERDKNASTMKVVSGRSVHKSEKQAKKVYDRIGAETPDSRREKMEQDAVAFTHKRTTPKKTTP